MNSSGNWVADGTIGSMYLFILGGFFFVVPMWIVTITAVWSKSSRRAGLIGLGLTLLPVLLSWMMYQLPSQWQYAPGSGMDIVPALNFYGLWTIGFVVSLRGLIKGKV